jgi:hypothetical protein
MSNIEILIHLAQILSFASATLALVLVLGAIPYSLGKWVGRREESLSMAASSIETPVAFETRLSCQKISWLRKEMKHLSKGLPSAHVS